MAIINKAAEMIVENHQNVALTFSKDKDDVQTKEWKKERLCTPHLVNNNKHGNNTATTTTCHNNNNNNNNNDDDVIINYNIKLQIALQLFALLSRNQKTKPRQQRDHIL